MSKEDVLTEVDPAQNAARLALKFVSGPSALALLSPFRKALPSSLLASRRAPTAHSAASSAAWQSSLEHRTYSLHCSSLFWFDQVCTSHPMR